MYLRQTHQSNLEVEHFMPMKSGRSYPTEATWTEIPAFAEMTFYDKISDMRTVLDFLASVKVELTKVVWPTRSATIKLTLIVITVTIIVGFFVLGVDFVLAQLLNLVTKVKA